MSMGARTICKGGEMGCELHGVCSFPSLVRTRFICKCCSRAPILHGTVVVIYFTFRQLFFLMLHLL